MSPSVPHAPSLPAVSRPSPTPRPSTLGATRSSRSEIRCISTSGSSPWVAPPWATMIGAPSARPSFMECSRAARHWAPRSGSSGVRVAKYGAWTESLTPRSAATSPKRAQRFSFQGKSVTKGSSRAVKPRSSRSSRKAASGTPSGGSWEIPTVIIPEGYGIGPATGDRCRPPRPSLSGGPHGSTTTGVPSTAQS